MKALLIGNGGREHALAWKITQSRLVDKLYCTPGNPGIASIVECVDIAPTDTAALLAFAKKQNCELTVVGSEAPLVAGLVDVFTREGLKAFGPTKKGARLEGSKVFAKKLMHQHAIPTGGFRVFEAAAAAHACVDSMPVPLVVKADGLAAGKGVVVCKTAEQAHEAIRKIMDNRAFGDAGRQVIIEECLKGEETSILALTDGRTILPLLPSQDHKPVFDRDEGPNTGGMGAYAPAPCVTKGLMQTIEEKVLVRTVHALNHLHIRYRGVLYAGLMLSSSGAKVLEFNARFGDPETQPLLLLLKSDLVELMLAVIDGTLKDRSVDWHPGAAVCVVMASGGYPGAYEKGKVIEGLDAAAALPNVQVFHAGTAKEGGNIVTAGGRVLGVTARGADIAQAINAAYQAVEAIHFDGMHYRKDIGAKALQRK